MMLIFGLMLLLQTAACLDQFCSFGQSEHCHAALGHKLNLLMVRDAREYDLRLRHRINNTQDDPVCRVKYGRIKECDLYNNRPEVNIINGTVIINCVIRADSGNYILALTDSDGTETSRDLQVIVEAPIGSVEVSIICSSSGVMRVFCSSEGDQLHYSWTLNGDPLMDGNSSIDLDEGTDGDISCSVKNHVSQAQKNIRVKPCPGPTTAAVTSSLTSSLTSTSTQTSEYVLKFSLIALGCVALILILLFITICYIYKKKQLKWKPAAAGDTELIYTDISHEKKSEKKNTGSLDFQHSVPSVAILSQTQFSVQRIPIPWIFQICCICQPHDNSYPAKHGRRAPGFIAIAALLNQPHAVANRPCKACICPSPRTAAHTHCPTQRPGSPRVLDRGSSRHSTSLGHT
ncbi:uncharacterized protein LOC109107599 [Cyprinus carpio]|uniref:Uncharacterized protein LOC109107599 n=1 Tax=Cyprinus carpio TaxID=7962 RepID=A0A9R0B909_CYPCA|nr:uncharacterized protein LOC109107599 [Cyprinus carpio]